MPGRFITTSYFPLKCLTEPTSRNSIAPRRKEKYLLISPNLACFTSLRESFFYRFGNSKTRKFQICLGSFFPEALQRSGEFRLWGVGIMEPTLVTPTFQHSISYLITFCARRSPSSAPLRPKRPPSTSCVCWPIAGASSRMLAGVLDR